MREIMVKMMIVLDNDDDYDDDDNDGDDDHQIKSVWRHWIWQF